MSNDTSWDEYKRLILQFGEEMGVLIRDDAKLRYWKRQFETIVIGDSSSKISELADRLIGCKHPRIKEWCHWSTNNSWPLMVYTAWYEITQKSKAL